MNESNMTIRTTMLLPVILFFSCCGFAQSVPKMEVLAGYTFTNLRPASGPSGTLHGWNTGVQWNLTRRLGLVGEAAGSYGSDPYVKETLHSYTFGPRVYFHRSERTSFYGHTLLGVGFLRISQGEAFDTSSGFASQIGGGVDVKLSRVVGLRAGQLDYMLTRFADRSQHNFRFSAGFVFRFGGKSL